MVPRDPSQVVGITDYGGCFAAAVAKGSAFAVQFHPEKSQSSGKRLLDALKALFHVIHQHDSMPAEAFDAAGRGEDPHR